MKHEYACIMAQLEFPEWDTILKMIDPKDLNKTGLEKHPHITVLWGIETEVKMLDIIKIVQDWPRPDVQLGQFAFFEDREMDILYLKTESFDIGVCRELARTLPNYQSIPFYTPHVTVAYLKSGTAKKYLDMALHIPVDAYRVSHFKIQMSSGKQADVNPKFTIMNYTKFKKAISHAEFKKMHIEKTGQIATVLDSAFISGHSYNKSQITGQNDDAPLSGSGGDSEQE